MEIEHADPYAINHLTFACTGLLATVNFSLEIAFFGSVVRRGGFCYMWSKFKSHWMEMPLCSSMTVRDKNADHRNLTRCLLPKKYDANSGCSQTHSERQSFRNSTCNLNIPTFAVQHLSTLQCRSREMLCYFSTMRF